MMLGGTADHQHVCNTFTHSFDKDPLMRPGFIVQHASVMMSISQISETLFILTIPFFLSRYGIKNVMLISIVAWMLAFQCLFAYGDPTPFGTVLLVLSICVRLRLRLLQHFWLGVCRKEVRRKSRQRGDVLMMTNGFGCIWAAVVSGKWWVLHSKRHYRLADRVAHLRSGLLAGAGFLRS